MDYTFSFVLGFVIVAFVANIIWGICMFISSWNGYDWVARGAGLVVIGFIVGMIIAGCLDWFTKK